MNEVYVLDKEFLFKSNIHAITSISLEHSYDVDASKVTGEFVISGDYRLHEVSINKEDFSFKVPFNTEVRSNVNLDSVEVEITDFSYNVSDDELSVHIEYLVSGEQSLIEFAEESDLEEFLHETGAEVVDLSEESNVDEPIIEETRTEETRTEESEVKEEEPPTAEVRDDEEGINKEAIISNINSEESFITYHVHTVLPADTVESICLKYDISLEDLKKLNNVDELAINSKLIIADEETSN